MKLIIAKEGNSIKNSIYKVLANAMKKKSNQTLQAFLKQIYICSRLSKNKLSGPVPDLSPLKALEILYISWSKFIMVFALFMCLSLIISASYGADTISSNDSISGDNTIISEGEKFELGFFKAVSSIQ